MIGQYSATHSGHVVLPVIDAIAAALTNATSEQRAAVAFIAPYRVDENNYITFLVPDRAGHGIGFIEDDEHGYSYASFSHTYSSSKTVRYSYRGENFAEAFLAMLDEIVTWFDLERTRTRFVGHYMPTSVPPLPNDSGARLLLNVFYLDGMPYAQRRPSDISLRPSQAYARSITSYEIKFGRSGVPEMWIVVAPIVSDRETLSRVHNHSANVLEYLPSSIVAQISRRDGKGGRVWQDEVAPRLFGIELEVSTNYSMRDLVNAQGDDLFFMGKADSSIRGSKSNMIELVTAPLSRRAHRRHWAKMFDNLDYSNFDCSRDTENGLHVHVGIEEFGVTNVRNPDRTLIDRSQYKNACARSAHLRNYLWFLADPANKDFLLWISERTGSQWDRWCPSPEIRSTNRMAEHNRIVSSWFEQRDRGAPGGSRLAFRGCAAFSMGGTVETRIFKGFVSYGSVMKGLDFVDALIEYTGTCGYRTCTLWDFIAWLENTPKQRYSFLKMYMQEAGGQTKLRELIDAARISSVIMKERDPDRIVELFERQRVFVNKATVSYLNSLFPKKTFELRGKQLVAIVSNRTPIAKHDLRMQAKRAMGARKIPRRSTATVATAAVSPGPENGDIAAQGTVHNTASSEANPDLLMNYAAQTIGEMLRGENSRVLSATVENYGDSDEVVLPEFRELPAA
jgi:hypothetical protein